jgi:hypothetical protein
LKAFIKIKPISKGDVWIFMFINMAFSYLADSNVV